MADFRQDFLGCKLTRVFLQSWSLDSWYRRWNLLPDFLFVRCSQDILVVVIFGSTCCKVASHIRRGKYVGRFLGWGRGGEKRSGQIPVIKTQTARSISAICFTFFKTNKRNPLRAIFYCYNLGKRNTQKVDISWESFCIILMTLIHFSMQWLKKVLYFVTCKMMWNPSFSVNKVSWVLSRAPSSMYSLPWLPRYSLRAESSLQQRLYVP